MSYSMVELNNRMIQRDVTIEKYVKQLDGTFSLLHPELSPKSFLLRKAEAQRNVDFFCSIAPHLEHNPSYIAKPLYNARTGTMFIINYLKNGDPSSWPLQIYGNLNEPELETTIRLLDLVQKTEGQKMTVLDIGSGLGYASTALASRGIQSIAIDASPTNQQLFLRTLCHNEEAIRNSIVFLPSAFGDSKKQCSILYGIKDHLNNAVTLCNNKPGQDTKFKEVVLDTLDDLFAADAPAIGLINLDTEGFEYRVLAGGAKFLKTKKPPLILTKVNHEGLTREGSNVKEFVSLIQSLGYSIHMNCSTPQVSSQDFEKEPLNKGSVPVCLIHEAFQHKA